MTISGRDGNEEDKIHRFAVSAILAAGGGGGETFSAVIAFTHTPRNFPSSVKRGTSAERRVPSDVANIK